MKQKLGNTAKRWHHQRNTTALKLKDKFLKQMKLYVQQFEDSVSSRC